MVYSRLPMKLRFSKYHGIGNDFVVVDGLDPAVAQLDAAKAAAICDRHRGVGADGVLVVGPEPSMRVWNADGSRAEMCGNGIRCVAVHLARQAQGRGEAGPFEWQIETDAGAHRCVVDALDDDIGATVAVTMAVPSLVPADLPTTASEPLVDSPFELRGIVLGLTAVSMGNPHAITFDDVGDERRELGPALSTDPRFPEGVNAGFARPAKTGGFELFVFERGSGWTRACGTGACAAAVAVTETGRGSRGEALPVHLPGGTLTITVGTPDEPVLMSGPARHVFDAALDLEALEVASEAAPAGERE